MTTASSKKKINPLNLLNSLRWRQLISSLVIIATGISGAGVVYYFFKNDAALQQQGGEMHSDKLHILNSILKPDPSVNLYVMEDHSSKGIQEFNKFLSNRKFSAPYDKPDEEYYAYVQDTVSREIVWSSKHPYERAFNGTSPYKSMMRGFSLFDISLKPRATTTFLKIIPPISSKGRNPSNRKSSEKTNEFIVHGIGFTNDKKLYQIILAKSAARLHDTRASLLQDLTWLVIVTSLLVLLAQLAGSYIVLAPIRRIEDEIKLIEAGEKDLIEHEYPSELNPVKSAINTLINAEKGQKKRYRDALDNLAHALKTPLAALQSSSARSEGEEKINQTYVDDQIQRMNDIVAYQLRRAVVSDHNAIVKLESLRPIVFRLRESLLKVYFDKNFILDINIDEYARCRVDYDDLMEVFGNLLNNACRFCESKIVVTATHDVDFLIIDIDDDGMGFPDNNPSQLLKRGMRADSKTEGQGIGLAVSAEIIENAGGKITLLMSPFIGARVRLHLPV